jgi:hypothetical protein
MKKLLLLIVAASAAACQAAEPLAIWHKRTAPTNLNLNAVIFANGRFVAVGDRAQGVSFSSTDGTTWNAHPTGVDKDLSGLAFGNNTVVAIGYSGRALTSPDGTSWTRQETGTSAHFDSVRFLQGQFVAVGDAGAIYLSPNGVSWTPRSTPSTNYWNDVTYFKGQYVLVGWDYKTAEARYGVTSDFLSINMGYTGYARYLDSVLPVGDKLLAVGYAGAAQSSADGIQWEPAVQASTRWLFGADAFNDTVVAVGERGAIARWTADEGWVRRTSDNTETLNSVAFGLNTFVAVGENGTILQSDPILPASAGGGLALENPSFGSSQFTFEFNGELGHSYSVQATTDFVIWTSVLSIQCSASPMQCAVPNQTPGRRYYRLARQ